MGESIRVEASGGGEFAVTVGKDLDVTRHRVQVDPAYHERLTDGGVPVEELVRESFAFLLEREPKEAILGRFDLPVIGRYFPEYEAEIARRLAGRGAQ